MFILNELMAWTGYLSAGFWLLFLAQPWQPWRVRPVLEARLPASAAELGDITVLIPARNEAAVIGRTLTALLRQGVGLRILVVDDQSTDATAAAVRAISDPRVSLLEGTATPAGWSGKLWALEQGRQQVQTPLVLLLDADIELAAGTVNALKNKRQQDGLAFVSLMAAPRLEAAWEKVLMPAFVHFFKLLYPFQLANSQNRWVAAAAGGCILMETPLLDRIGGFAPIRAALIDDCALARQVKNTGARSWIGLTHAAQSQRTGADLSQIWNMVARTAFTQLHYSVALLLLCTALMLAGFLFPVLALASLDPMTSILGATALGLMLLTYYPNVRYYRLSVIWVLSFPFAALLYLLMTWSSALRYWRGERARWKDRVYATEGMR